MGGAPLAVVFAITTSACVGTATTTCPDRSICPEGTACLSVKEGDPYECVTDDQLAACKSVGDRASCAVNLVEGTCFGGACLPAGCGNRRIDVSEACDDGNSMFGDGCAADCRSDETCGNGIVDPLADNVPGLPGEQCDDANDLGHDGCSSACRSEVTTWTPIVSTPTARTGAAMALDPRRARLVVFGGQFIGPTQVGSQFALNDTWEFDGSGWSRVPTGSAPTERFGHAMTYDADAGRIVLFGGGTGASVLNDTWELDGNRWVQVNAGSGPPARMDHAMVYMPHVGVVLFGGSGATGELSDTWIRRSGTWTKLALVSPGRTLHGMAYDPVRNVVVLSGGRPVSDTYEFDGTTWRNVALAPHPDGGAAIAWDPSQRSVIAFGGTRLGPGPIETNETWTWNSAAWELAGPAPTPPVRSLAAIGNDPVTGAPIIFGGESRDTPCGACDLVHGDTWRWNGAKWGELGPPRNAPPTPAPNPLFDARTNHAGAYDVRRKKVVVHGGKSSLGVSVGDTMEFDGTKWSPVLGTGPGPRTDAGMGYDVTRSQVVLFGGTIAPASYSDETWVFDGQVWQLRAPTTSPSRRTQHAMAYDSSRQRLVLFGGTDGALSNETWEWDGTNWARKTPPIAPSPRQEHVLAYDPLRRRVVLFGGATQSGSLADLWEWDGSTWLDRTPLDSPSPRQRAAMAWDGARQRMILFGGGAVSGNDTWEWNGANASWTVIQPFVTIEQRFGHVMVQAPGQPGVIVIGGSGPKGELDQIAHLDRISSDSYELCRTNIDDDGDGLGGCADPDCWAACNPTCPPGAICEPGAPRCGDGACNTALENCRLCPGDCPCSPICGDFACDPGETAASCFGDCS